MRRFHITLGATTTAKGVVATATSGVSINGARMAVEGDEVNCGTCGTTGVIRCIGPRLSERWNGKQVALENDLCICQCNPPPRLLPNQAYKSQLVGDSSGMVPTTNPATVDHQAADELLDG
ncbi:MAG: PAAR domain-containing protein [Massilia sp.]